MDSKKFNILLADDNMDDCAFFKRALNALAISTNLTTVDDGDELIQYFHEKPEHLPHVLFLDINMPRKNGIECLAKIRQTERLKELPVAMFSTSNSWVQ